MDFLETQQYSTADPTATLPVPPGWRQYEHPNHDIYFYNRELRLITPDDIRQPERHRYVLEAYYEFTQALRSSPAYRSLPQDCEFVIAAAGPEVSTNTVFSRSEAEAFAWNDTPDLIRKSRTEFWAHVAEYPSHHPNLPPGTEEEFLAALRNAKVGVARGAIYGISEEQIDRATALYWQFKEFQRQGRNVTARLAWLMGAVMPLNEVPAGSPTTANSNLNLDLIMNGDHD